MGSTNAEAQAPAQRRTKEAVRRARHDAYREAILEAAERIFAARGYADTRVQEIAEAAGVSTGTVYGIFPGKEDLYRAVHRRNLDELAERYAEIDAGLGVAELMLARVEVSTRFLTSRPDYLRMYLREAGGWGHDPGDLPASATAFMDTDLYRRGVDAGELVPEDPELIQSLLMAAGQVHLAHWLRAGGTESPDALIARLQEHYRRAFFAS